MTTFHLCRCICLPTCSSACIWSQRDHITSACEHSAVLDSKIDNDHVRHSFKSNTCPYLRCQLYTTKVGRFVQEMICSGNCLSGGTIDVSFFSKKRGVLSVTLDEWINIYFTDKTIIWTCYSKIYFNKSRSYINRELSSEYWFILIKKGCQRESMEDIYQSTSGNQWVDNMATCH